MSQTALNAARCHYSRLAGTNVAAETLRAYLLSHPCSPSLTGPCRPRFYAARPTQRTENDPSREPQDASEHEKKSSFSERARRRLANREFFTNLISSAASRRDAKAYISRLKSPATAVGEQKSASKKPQPQVETGDLFGRTRASDASPVFTQYGRSEDQTIDEQEPLHVALVKISNISAMADNLLKGIAQTLSSLSRLSMAPCVVLEEPLQGDRQGCRQHL